MCSYLAMLACLLCTVSSRPDIYLQSQKGGENIHVHIKNIKLKGIIAGETSSNASHDDDFDYDYGQITLKPTSGHSSSTSSYDFEETIDVHPISVDSMESSDSSSNSTTISAPTSNTTEPNTDNRRSIDKGGIRSIQCAFGYIRDNSGKCRRINKPFN